MALGNGITIKENVEYTCLTMELQNASAVSEMRIKHQCPRENYGPSCYRYLNSIFEMSVFLMFSDKCMFEIFAWGFRKNMTLLDIQEWKWEEGTYYEDFSLKRAEYRGTAHMTGYGFEPLDHATWVPEYDIWTTTTPSNITTTPRPKMVSKRTNPTRRKKTTRKTKKTPRRKTKPTTKKTQKKNPQQG